jgi:hypothetical protein
MEPLAAIIRMVEYGTRSTKISRDCLSAAGAQYLDPGAETRHSDLLSYVIDQVALGMRGHRGERFDVFEKALTARLKERN